MWQSKERTSPHLSHRVQNSTANKIGQHLGKALQFARHEPAGEPLQPRRWKPGATTTHHDDGFVDEISRPPRLIRIWLLSFKQMKGLLLFMRCHQSVTEATVAPFGRHSSRRPPHPRSIRGPGPRDPVSRMRYRHARPNPPPQWRGQRFRSIRTACCPLKRIL